MIFDTKNYGDRVALVDEMGYQVYYKDILEYEQKVVSAIGTRKHIYLIASTSLGMLIHYIALLNTDHIIQVVDETASVSHHMSYLKKYKPDYICEAIDDTRSYECVAYGYGIRYSGEMKDVRCHRDLTLLLPTSGSTGSSKFVRLSKKNLLTNTRSIIEYLEIKENDRAILSLPLSYTFGLSILHTHIMVGATLLVPHSKIYQKSFWDFFQKYQGTTFSGVPYTFEMLDKLHLLGISRNLSYVTQAGGRLSRAMQDRMLHYAKINDFNFIIMYGQTEATARMTYLPSSDFMQQQKIGSVGVPIPGGKIEIHTDNAYCDALCDTEEQGEVVYKGDNVCMGYAYGFADLQKEDENKGVLRTGDMGYLDGDGYLFLTGRIKRFVKIVGKRYSLDDMENKVQDKYRIPCAVVGDDNKICIVVIAGDANEIMNYVRTEFHLHSHHLQIKFVDEIPRLQSGKINYSVLGG